jgi:hypothetical protein
MNYQPLESAEKTQRSMAFLYGNRSIGETGSDGPVRVTDVPPQTVLSIGFRGERTPEKVLSARQQLLGWMDANSGKYQPNGELRVMGYNSRFIAPSRKYFEVQLPITVDPVSTAGEDLSVELDLSDYVWKNRVLIAFAPSNSAPSYAALLKSWRAEREAVAERDLLLVELLEEGESSVGEVRLPLSTPTRLREQFGVQSGQTIFILVGDGTVKLRRASIRLSDLLEVIDAMPMRRAEILRKSSK